MFNKRLNYESITNYRVNKMTTSICTTTKVFIPHNALIWVTGEVLSESGVNFEVRIVDVDVLSDRNDIVKLSKPQSLPLQNIDIPNEGVDDMCILSYLHEPGILDNLRRRFLNKKPYTFTGLICIAVNPYQWLDNYSTELREQYSKSYHHELPPHVYATSAAAYRGLVTRSLNQSILVSGESGAGKTETVKILMSHLAHIASRKDDHTVDKLLKANPLLESFGNAKTVRNDNSSRFGKFSRLEFDGCCTLVGSRCITYLLEKSRVVVQNPHERNYHIMYELLAAPPEIRDYLYFTDYNDPVQFNYMSGGDIDTQIIEGVTDANRYEQTIAALELLGVTFNTRVLLESVLAGVLHLGQLMFAASASDIDTVSLSVTGSDEVSDNSLEACIVLFGISSDLFSSTLVTRTIEVEGKTLVVPLSMEQVVNGRDALAKEIYSRLFRWLVLVINFNTSCVVSCNSHKVAANLVDQSATSRSSRGSNIGSGNTRNRNNVSSLTSFSTISLLDIFGFESFTINHFEQLCINYANEKLQQKFAQDVFKTVQQEYVEEGLTLQHILFQDNADVLELIEGRQGIISYLTEECMMPKGSDMQFLSKVFKQCIAHRAFSISRLSTDMFNIHHYAGVVSYTVTGFTERNKDTLMSNMSEMFLTSTNKLIQKLFAYPQFFQGDSEEQLMDRLLAGDCVQNASFLMVQSESDGGGSISAAPSVVCAVATRDSVGANQVASIGAPSRGSFSSIASSVGGSRSNSITSSSGNDGAVRRRSTDSQKSSFVCAETVTSKFQSQVASLMGVIAATEVQYVRCIKPNSHKSSREFDRSLVVEQLRSGGMIEAVRISRAAYPNRIPYHEFLCRYRYIQSASWYQQQSFRKSQQPSENRQQSLPSSSSHIKKEFGSDSFDETVKVCKELVLSVLQALKLNIKFHASLSSTDLDLYQFGRTKIYFSSILLEQLESLRAKCMFKYAVHIQAFFRCYRCRKDYKLCLQALMRIQATIRGFIERCRYVAVIIPQRTFLKVIIRLQVKYRGYLQKKKYHKIKSSIILIQSVLRMKHAQWSFVRRRNEKESTKLLSLQHQQEISRLQSQHYEWREQEQQLIADLNRLTLDNEQIQYESSKRNAELQSELTVRRCLVEEAEKENERLRIEAAKREESLQKSLYDREVLLMRLESDFIQEERSKMELLVQLAELQAQQDAAEAEFYRVERQAQLRESALQAELIAREEMFKSHLHQKDLEVEVLKKKTEEEVLLRCQQAAEVELLQKPSEILLRHQKYVEEKYTSIIEAPVTNVKNEKDEIGEICFSGKHMSHHPELQDQSDKALCIDDPSIDSVKMKPIFENQDQFQLFIKQHGLVLEKMKQLEADIQTLRDSSATAVIMSTSAKDAPDALTDCIGIKSSEPVCISNQSPLIESTEFPTTELQQKAQSRIHISKTFETMGTENITIANSLSSPLFANKELLQENETTLLTGGFSVNDVTITHSQSVRVCCQEKVAGDMMVDVFPSSTEGLLEKRNKRPRLSLSSRSSSSLLASTHMENVEVVSEPSCPPHLLSHNLKNQPPKESKNRLSSDAIGNQNNLKTLRNVFVALEPKQSGGDSHNSNDDSKCDMEVQRLQSELMALKKSYSQAMQLLVDFVREQYPQQPSSLLPPQYRSAGDECNVTTDESVLPYKFYFSVQLDLVLTSITRNNCIDVVPVQQILRPHVIRYREHAAGFIQYEISFHSDHLEPFEKRRSPTIANIATSGIGEISVHRRFSEFAALWARLTTQTHKISSHADDSGSKRVKIPTLPQKQLLSQLGERWKRRDFLNSRCAQLDTWLSDLLLVLADPAVVTAGNDNSSIERSRALVKAFLTPPYFIRESAELKVYK